MTPDSTENQVNTSFHKAREVRSQNPSRYRPVYDSRGTLLYLTHDEILQSVRDNVFYRRPPPSRSFLGWIALIIRALMF